jgi:N-acetylglutamate synthase-like GNAT family acetyltransferase
MAEVVKQKPTVEQLANFYLDAGWFKDPYSLDLQKSIEHSSLWMLAKEGEEVVGLVRLQTDYVRYCAIYDLIVRSDRRGTGIGTQLLNTVLAFCDEAGIGAAHLWPTKGNKGFYERFGFTSLEADQPLMYRTRPPIG